MSRKISLIRSSRLTLLFGAALSCTAPALAQESAPEAAAIEPLTPAEDRISDSPIHADHETYKATQGRIKALNDRGIEVDNYHLSKAQCWLDTSFHEYSRNDRGGYPQAALSQSATLIAALEAGADPGWETPLVNGAEKLRPDLWARYDALKKHKGFECAAQATACAEVELVHAGNEIHGGGWRHAKPYIQIAEDLLSKAEVSAAACIPEPAPPAPPAAPETERFDLAADALFKFDRGDLAGLLPEGKAKLDELVARVAGTYAQIDALRLVGHTDRLGSETYNLRLSEQRAATIKQYLQGRGLSAIIEARGVGESLPSGQAAECVGPRATAELKACLQPDRRVGVEIVGVRRKAN